VLVIKALLSRAMPVHHTSHRVMGRREREHGPKRFEGVQVLAAGSGSETVESTSISSKAGPFAGLRRTEVFGLSAALAGSPAREKGSMGDTGARVTYEEGRPHLAGPSLGWLGPRGLRCASSLTG
jgi:hypothetical protein